MRKKDKKRVFDNGKIHTVSAISENLICSGRLMIQNDISNIDDVRITEILHDFSRRNDKRIFEIRLNQIVRFGCRDGVYEIVDGFDYLTVINKIWNCIGIYYKDGNFTLNPNDSKYPYINNENPKFYYHYQDNKISNLMGRLMNTHFLILINLDKKINNKSLDNLKSF